MRPLAGAVQARCHLAVARCLPHCERRVKSPPRLCGEVVRELHAAWQRQSIRMKLRTPIAAVALLALAGLAACGGDDSSGSTTTVAVPTDNTPVGTDPTGSGFEHASGPDDVVISV